MAEQDITLSFNKLKEKRVTAVKLELECNHNRFNHEKIKDKVRDLGLIPSLPEHLRDVDLDEEFYYCPSCQHFDYDSQEVVDDNYDEGYGYLEDGDTCYDCRDSDDDLYDRDDLTPIQPYREMSGTNVGQYEGLLAIWLHAVHAKAKRPYTRSDAFTQSVDSNDKSPYSSNLIHFARLYYDGSCGAEMTITVPLTLANTKRFPMLVEEFRELIREYGIDKNGAPLTETPVEEFPINGAGLHIGLMFSKNMRYPIQYTSFVTVEQLKTLRKAVYRLAPAMYVLANRQSSDGETRPFSYRGPEVNWCFDSYYGPENDLLQDRSVSINTRAQSTKYSAIKYSNGCLEFRIFDPVFDNPTQVLDNIEVIANIMQFFDKDESVLDVFNALPKDKWSYQMGSEHTNNLNEWFDSPTVMPILYFGLNLLKPQHLSIGDIRKRVGFTVSGNAIKRMQAHQDRVADQLYELYQVRIKQIREMNAEFRNNGGRGDLVNVYDVSKSDFKVQMGTSRLKMYQISEEE